MTTENNKLLNRNGNRRGMSLNSQKQLLGVQGIGNPKNNHAKKELSITRKQREMLLLPCPYAPGLTWVEWLAERGLALAGENATYYKELLDRLEGKVTLPIDALMEVKNTRDLTDAELTNIAAPGLIKDSAFRGGN